MTTTVLSDGSTQYNLFTDFQTVIVDQGVERETASSTAINVSGFDNTTVLVAGLIKSANTAYTVGSISALGNALIVAKGGFVFGDGTGASLTGIGTRAYNDGRIEGISANGISAGGSHVEIENSGVIKGGIHGVANTYSVSVVNSGKIVGATNGIFTIGLSGNGDLHLENSGLIKGETGINYSDVLTTGGQIVNSGKIRGTDGTAIDGNDSVQVIQNSGLIDGDISLEDGDDVYFGRGGKVEGTVFGGDGSDLLIGGNAKDRFRGGTDADLIRGEGGNDQIWGDDGFDFVSGGNGNDTVRGGAQNDTVLGGRGGDKLFGGADNDLLTGGRGNDALTGGTGADDFIYKGKTGKDVIHDFEKGLDDIDLSSYGVTMAFNKFEKKAIDYKNGNAHIDLDKIGGDGEIVVKNITDFDIFDFIF